ncbi:MAG: hypothetical protein NXH85_00395 [Pseudomonadaceae bacterium]|nr:hypothetical protein [Pseudomonadaceae bacterium]
MAFVSRVCRRLVVTLQVLCHARKLEALARLRVELRQARADALLLCAVQASVSHGGHNIGACAHSGPVVAGTRLYRAIAIGVGGWTR